MRMPGWGTALCAGTTRARQPSCKLEVEGLEYCLHHMPDDLLELAEQIMGFRRCRTRFGQPAACRFYAVNGSSPPRCKVRSISFRISNGGYINKSGHQDRSAGTRGPLVAGR
jgi:hypothetical protein